MRSIIHPIEGSKLVNGLMHAPTVRQKNRCSPHQRPMIAKNNAAWGGALTAVHHRQKLPVSNKRDAPRQRSFGYIT